MKTETKGRWFRTVPALALLSVCALPVLGAGSRHAYRVPLAASNPGGPIKGAAAGVGLPEAQDVGSTAEVS